MKKILIFGNSASGKTTLAKRISQTNNFAHLDLDSLAWDAVTPPVRKSLSISKKLIDDFMLAHNSWVIEGCYTDLLGLAESCSSEIIYLNLSIGDCIKNAKSRPWEPHKYTSKQAQDKNLAMLIDWISQYATRKDQFSMVAHQRFYDNYKGAKQTITCHEITA